MQVAMERSWKLLPSHKTCLAVLSLSTPWKSELLEEVSRNSSWLIVDRSWVSALSLNVCEPQDLKKDTDQV